MRRPIVKDRVLKAHRQNPEWTASEIAKHLGVTGSAVRNVARRSGLKLARKTEIVRANGKVLRPVTPDMIRQMAKMHDEGWSYAKISRHLGIAECTVSYSVRGKTQIAASVLGLSRDDEKSVPEPEPSERTAATVHGAHLENYHRARRGFHVPGHLECKYFDLLKKGLPRAEAARKLGLLEEASS